MEIVWLGHCCFRIKGADLTVVSDPFDDSLGYRPGTLRADVVTLSHEGPHHGHLERVEGVKKVLRGPGEYEVSGAFILGIKTFRDNQGGAERGVNAVYRMTIDNLNVCHLGDIGHVPTSDNVSAIGDVDILLIPVGGSVTLTPSQASETVGLLEPKVVIPMHYKTEAISEPLEPVEGFLKEFGIKDAQPLPKLSAAAASIPAGPQIVLLDYRQP